MPSRPPLLRTLADLDALLARLPDNWLLVLTDPHAGWLETEDGTVVEFTTWAGLAAVDAAETEVDA